MYPLRNNHQAKALIVVNRDDELETRFIKYMMLCIIDLPGYEEGAVTNYNVYESLKNY